MSNLLTLSLLKKYKEPSDIQLAKQAIRGDAEAFSTLIGNYKVYLYKIAYSYTKDEQKSLDIIQETAYKGLKGIKKLKDPQYFKTWITRVLINIAIDESKKEGNVVYLEDENYTSSISQSFSVDEKLDLYDAINILRFEYKIVIILKYFNDLTEAQIATTMDIPLSTVKSHLRRAKEQLKNILKEGEYHA